MRRAPVRSIVTAGALLAVLSGCGGDIPITAPPPRPGTELTQEAREDLAPEPNRAQASERTIAPAPDVPRSPATIEPVEPSDPPVSVEVDAVRIEADVVPVGIADDGQMKLPRDPDIVGWYRYGPTAGNGQGSVVLAGHVDTRRHGIGQLSRLRETEVGDEIVVSTESGADIRYTVEDVRSIPKAELPLAEVFSRDGDERLVLITCGGEFDRARGSYTDNVVVTAAPA